MITELNEKILGNMRDGLMNGADFVRERARRVAFRKPWTYREPVGSFLRRRPWLLGTLAVSILAVVVAGILYFRKRSQITDGGMESDSGDVEAMNVDRALQEPRLQDTDMAATHP